MDIETVLVVMPLLPVISLHVLQDADDPSPPVGRPGLARSWTTEHTRWRGEQQGDS